MLRSFPDDFETLARNLRTEFLQDVDVMEIFPMLLVWVLSKVVFLICCKGLLKPRWLIKMLGSELIWFVKLGLSAP